MTVFLNRWILSLHKSFFQAQDMYRRVRIHDAMHQFFCYLSDMPIARSISCLLAITAQDVSTLVQYTTHICIFIISCPFYFSLLGHHPKLKLSQKYQGIYHLLFFIKISVSTILQEPCYTLHQYQYGQCKVGDHS